jgi:hypothetical protein
MTDLVLLTDAEITAVAGGAVTQTVSVAVTQQSTSTVTESATATNAGPVTASANGSLIRATMLMVNPAGVAVVPRIDVFAILKTVGIC